MKILCIGDIVGKPGREAVETLVPQLKNEFGIDFVIANAENVSPSQIPLAPSSRE